MKRYQGVTLIEMLLVLVIAAGIMYFGVKQYHLYRLQSDITQVQVNVNSLFNAMSKFYRAQCYGSVDPNNPSASPLAGTGVLRTTTTSPYAIDITKDLFNNGYLNIQMPLSPLISPTVGTDGFVAQFNRYTQVVRKCQDQGSWGPYTSMGCSTNTPPQIGTLVLWKAQVAILLQDPITAQQFKQMMSADCISTMQNGIVTPCPGSVSGSGVFLVWERIPSASTMSIEATSPTQASIPAVQNFTNMYRVSGASSMINISHTPETTFFYCGG